VRDSLLSKDIVFKTEKGKLYASQNLYAIIDRQFCFRWSNVFQKLLLVYNLQKLCYCCTESSKT